MPVVLGRIPAAGLRARVEGALTALPEEPAGGGTPLAGDGPRRAQGGLGLWREPQFVEDFARVLAVQRGGAAGLGRGAREANRRSGPAVGASGQGVAVVSLWPGLVRTELILSQCRDNGRGGLEMVLPKHEGDDGPDQAIDLVISESPRFSGRAVAADVRAGFLAAWRP